MDEPTVAARQQAQCERMAWMPWLYHRAKPSVRAWAEPWQREIHARLTALEAVELEADCFVAPSARIFAEPNRTVEVGTRASIAAECFVHGPVTLAAEVSLNPRVYVDGGRAGVTIGPGTRVATGTHIFAFDHGLDPRAPIRDQPVRSRGIRIGADVWIGAGAGITDGVTIHDHAVVAMHAVVTRDVPEYAIVAGVPAVVVGDRRSMTPHGADPGPT